MSTPTLPPVGPSQVRVQDIDWSGLANTILGMQGSLGLSEAAQKTALDEIHKQVQAVQQQAAGAQQAYAEAAQAPAPMQGQVPNLLDQIAGGAASIVSRNPLYQQQALKRGEDQQQALADARTTNLKMLRDHYERQAMAAEQMGKVELAAQLRSKVDSVDKAQQSILDKTMQGRQASITQANQAGIGMEQTLTKGQQAMDLERLRQQGQQELASLKEQVSLKFGTEMAGRFESAAKITWNGKKVIDAGMFIGKSRDTMLQWASDNGVIPVGKDQMKVLEDIQGARGNAQKIMESIGPMLSKTPLERYTTGLRNRFGRIFQTNGTLGGYRTWRGSAIRALRAAAGSGGLRLNQAEINLAVKNDIPDEMDTIDTANQKIQNLVDMLDSAEDPLTTHDWRTLTPGGGMPGRTSGAGSAGAPAAPGAAKATQADRDFVKSLGY